MLQRDLYRAVKAYSQSALRPKNSDIEGLEAESRKLDEAVAAAKPDAGTAGEKKVELF
jgi:hypothetical protein